MKILCPTDLSDHSKKAVKYAIQLANELNAALHFISVLEVPKEFSALATMDKMLVESRRKELDEIVAAISHLITTDFPPTVIALPGFTVEEILKYSESEQIDFIVMGTQGRNSLRGLLFGSVTQEIADSTSIPLLAIPMDYAQSVSSKKMLLALDNKILNDEALFRIPKLLAKQLGLTIDILHIEENANTDLPIDPFISEYLGDLIGEVIIEEGTDPVKDIKAYAENQNVKILLMIRRKKGFLTKLLFTGDTSEELSLTNIPLMILPE